LRPNAKAIPSAADFITSRHWGLKGIFRDKPYFLGIFSICSALFGDDAGGAGGVSIGRLNGLAAMAGFSRHHPQ
jgi:hypothetical protein